MAKAKAKRKPSSGLLQELNVSEELYQIVKVDKISRGEMVKKVWAYIRKNGLQDEDNRRMINPDDLLGDVLGHKSINMFQMTKVLSKHLTKDD
jgi:upstream activation factor subunit UAF30